MCCLPNLFHFGTSDRRDIRFRLAVYRGSADKVDLRGQEHLESGHVGVVWAEILHFVLHYNLGWGKLY